MDLYYFVYFLYVGALSLCKWIYFFKLDKRKMDILLWIYDSPLNDFAYCSILVYTILGSKKESFASIFVQS